MHRKSAVKNSASRKSVRKKQLAGRYGQKIQLTSRVDMCCKSVKKRILPVTVVKNL